MKLKIDNREKKLIKLLEIYKKEFDLKNIECTVEKLDLGDFIICDDVKNSGNSFSWISKRDIDRYAFHRANHKVFKLFKSFNWDV